MATITSRVCDIDAKHTEGVEPITYSLGGEYFTADLCPADIEKLTKTLEPYTAVDKGRVPSDVVEAWRQATQN